MASRSMLSKLPLKVHWLVGHSRSRSRNCSAIKSTSASTGTGTGGGTGTGAARTLSCSRANSWTSMSPGTNSLMCTGNEARATLAGIPAPVLVPAQGQILVQVRSRAFHSSAVAPEQAADAEAHRPHPTDVQYAFTQPPALSAESQAKVDELFDEIVWLDMIEVHLLTQLVHEKMGGNWKDLTSAGGPAKIATVSANTDAETGETKQENALKDVKLMGYDAKAKIKVIKEVRAIAGLGLKEAKEMVESAPKILQKGLKPEQAQELKERLEAVGAQVEIS